MISVYRVFQLIMGIILSVFILYVLVDFAGSYAGVGEQASSQKRLDVFLQDVDSVEASGIPMNFTYFDNPDYSSCHPMPTTPPKISCFMDGKVQETRQIYIPILMRAGSDLLITRSSVDLGWTSVDHVEAITGTTFVFSPIGTDDATWNTVASLASVLPDTTGQDPKVYFDLCDGSDLLITSYFGKPYERRDFLDTVTYNRESLSECSANLGPNQVLVTVSDSCSAGYQGGGICIAPSDTGVGYAYISGSPDTFVYKDPMDLASLAIGGDSIGVFGTKAGQDTWETRNMLYLDALSISARIMERRTEIVYQRTQVSQECGNSYLDLGASLSSIGSLAQSDPYDIAAMTSLKEELDHARTIWNELEYVGCEPRE
jgi:hypothetical protein